MTYAIPSLTRVPATEKGLTIADFLVPVRVGERVSPRLRNVGLMVAGAALIILTSRLYATLPGTPVPFTLQSLGVLVVGGSLGLRRGAVAAALYLALGLVGLPVFAEARGGYSTVLGATGGYLVGFVLASALVGRLAELGWDRRFGGALGATLLGTAAIYLVGVPWLAASTGMSLGDAVTKGLVPFLAADAAKLVAAAVLFPSAWWVVGRRPSDR
jgi:biotin transport system substrate-specific component